MKNIRVSRCQTLVFANCECGWEFSDRKIDKAIGKAEAHADDHIRGNDFMMVREGVYGWGPCEPEDAKVDTRYV